MSNLTPKVLRFTLTTTENPFEVMARFFPQGTTLLNRTEWRGKESRSCGLTNVKMRPHSAGSNEPKVFDVEVTYRPRGCITFVGPTKYDGWTAMMLDRKQDGTLLDGHGNPLPEGQPPVYLPFEVHGDVEFNDIAFGDFVGEFEIGGVPRVALDDVLREFQESPRTSVSIRSSFMASRRHRPLVKIVLSNAPSGTAADGFGTRIVNINNYTPHLQQAILDELAELVSGFIEGRYSIKNMSNDELVFVELDDSLVDCTPNEEGRPSRFNCLSEHVPDSFLEDLAKRLMATYEIEVSVVDGPKAGLLLKTPTQPKGN